MPCCSPNALARPVHLPLYALLMAVAAQLQGEFVDYDGDDAPDVFLLPGAEMVVSSGYTSHGIRNALHINQRNGTFASPAAQEVGALAQYRPFGVGQLAVHSGWGGHWADFDNDGDLDVYVTSHQMPYSALLRNDAGRFKELSVSESSGLTGTGVHFCAWGDHDRDGNIDIIVATSTDTRLFVNSNSGASFSSVQLDTAILASVAWGDYNSDGYIDVVGHVDGEPRLRLYTNMLATGGVTSGHALDSSTGMHSFSRTYLSVDDTVSMYSTYSNGGGGNVAWGDLDGDGDLDLVFVSAGGTGAQATRVLFDNQDSTLTRHTSLAFPAGVAGVDAAGFNWVDMSDFDRDGDLDLTFFSDLGAALWENVGTTAFSFLQILSGHLVEDSYRLARGSWADMDGDGDLDLLTVDKADTSESHLYENRAFVTDAEGYKYDLSASAALGSKTSAGTDEAYPGPATTAWGDWDSDGDPDLVLADGVDGAIFYENRSHTPGRLQPTISPCPCPSSSDSLLSALH